MKHIKQHLENEHKRKCCHINFKRLILLNGKIIMRNTQHHQENTDYKLHFGRSKIENIPFFSVANAVIKQETKACACEIKQRDHRKSVSKLIQMKTENLILGNKSGKHRYILRNQNRQHQNENHRCNDPVGKIVAGIEIFLKKKIFQISLPFNNIHHKYIKKDTS